MPAASVTQGAHHIGLTVPDLDKAKTFFIDTLGFEQVGEVPEYPAAFVSDGTIMITLWRAADPDTSTNSCESSTDTGTDHSNCSCKF